MAAILIDEQSKYTLYLGRSGESDVESISIDCSAWLTTYPNATFVVAAQRPERLEVYLATDVTMTDGILKWDASSYDTSIAGSGQAEVRMLDNGVIKKSLLTTTSIQPSLSGQEVTPTVETANWINDAILNEQQRVANEEARNVYIDWTAEYPFVVGNKCVRNGNSYLCTEDCTGVEPPNTSNWLVIAAKGDDGITWTSTAATTLGTVVKKMEVFDAAGVSLGFIPIYDAIT